MIILFSLLVALVGVLMFALCVNPKLQEIGRIMFFCGLFTFLLNGLPSHWIGLLPQR
jgi:Na+/phosphate symporter